MTLPLSKSTKPKYSFLPLTPKILLHLSCHKNGISGSLTFHESKLHVINLNLLPNSVLKKSFLQLSYIMFQQFDPSVRSTLHRVAFAFCRLVVPHLTCHHENLLDFCGAGEDNGDRRTDSQGGRHPIRTNGTPTPITPPGKIIEAEAQTVPVDATPTETNGDLTPKPPHITPDALPAA